MTVGLNLKRVCFPSLNVFQSQYLLLYLVLISYARATSIYAFYTLHLS